jgi:ribosome-binding factor A
VSEEHKRAHRVAQRVQEELGQLLVDGLKDPRVGFVTVTEVRLGDDLHTARVYCSVYGSDEQREASIQGLKAASGYLRRELAHRLGMRYTPELVFVLDDTLDKAARLQQLLKAVEEGAPEAPAAEEVQPCVTVDSMRSSMAEKARIFEAENTPKKPIKGGRGKPSSGKRRR